MTATIGSPPTRIGSLTRRPSAPVGRAHRLSGRQLLDADIAKLHEAGSRRILSVLEPTVMLQSQPALRGNPGELGVFEHSPAVEQNGEAIALQGDFECIPFADRFVGP